MVKFGNGGGKHSNLNSSFFKLLFLVIFLNLLSFASFGFEYTENGVKYDFKIDTGTLTISKIDGDETTKREVSANGVNKAIGRPDISTQNTTVTTVKIEDGVTSIGDYAFKVCTKLTSIEIPKSVKRIGMNAFEGCSNLTSIEIPDDVESIGSGAFAKCTLLTSIKIPKDVTNIGVWVFSECSELTSVTIPNSVTSIGKGAFGYCSKLTSITIPDGVTSIGDYAFYSCLALSSGDVYYLGTEAEWNEIEKGEHNDSLKSAKIHCTGKMLTVKKVWDDNGNSSLRSKPQLVLYKLNGASGEYDEIDKNYTQSDFTYVDGGERVDFDNATGKVINGNGDEKKEWQCEIVLNDHIIGSTYAVGEKPMKGYTSEAYVD